MRRAGGFGTAPGPQAERGVTMLEVLIAALVLTAGLIGLAGLQGVSLHNSFSAYQRSQAVSLAYEVMDRIRASRACVGCDAAIDEHELWGEAQAVARLSQGELTAAQMLDIANDPVNNVVTVTVRWLDDRLEDGNDRITALAFSSRM